MLQTIDLTSTKSAIFITLIIESDIVEIVFIERLRTATCYVAVSIQLYLFIKWTH